MTAEQKVQIAQLSKKRKGCNPYETDGYQQYEKFGIDTGDYVVPWSIRAHGTKSRIMIIGQDWCSEQTLRNASEATKVELNRYGRMRDLPSNKNLDDHLGRYLGLTFADTWATEAFVWVKPGSMSAPIPYKMMLESVQKYTTKEIQIIQPKVAIVLGRLTYRAIKRLTDVKGGSSGRIVDLSPFEYNGVKIVPVYHTGSRSRLVDPKDIRACWTRVAKALKA